MFDCSCKLHLTSYIVAVLLIATNSHSLLWCGSLSKVVKSNVKPAVDFFVDGFVLGAEFFTCHTILESLPTCSSVHHIIISYMSGYIIIYETLSHIVYMNGNLGFSRCPILICTTNVQCVVVPESAKPV